MSNNHGLLILRNSERARQTTCHSSSAMLAQTELLVNRRSGNCEVLTCGCRELIWLIDSVTVERAFEGAAMFGTEDELTLQRR